MTGGEVSGVRYPPKDVLVRRFYFKIQELLQSNIFSYFILVIMLDSPELIQPIKLTNSLRTRSLN